MREASARWALLALAALLGAVLWWTLGQSLGRGDLGPRDSTLRAAPDGCKALYAALARSGAAVTRSHLPPGRFDLGPGDVYLVLGAPDDAFSDASEGEARALDAFVRGGGRLVIAFRGGAVHAAAEDADTDEGGDPARQRRARRIQERREREKEQERRRQEREDADRESREAADGFAPAATVDLLKTWGVHPDASVQVAADRAALTGAGVREGLDAFALRQPLPLALHGDDWTVWHQAGALPAAARRALGAGEIIVLADTFPLENGSLRREIPAALVARIGRGRTRWVFDEAHLGYRGEEGVMSLARRYRLTPFLFAALVCAGLWAWRTAVLQERRGRGHGDGALALDARAGLVSLLERSLADRDLPDAVHDTWRTDAAPHTAGARTRVAAAAARNQPDPVEKCRMLWRAAAQVPGKAAHKEKMP